jgi:hypothetical protein
MRHLDAIDERGPTGEGMGNSPNGASASISALEAIEAQNGGELDCKNDAGPVAIDDELEFRDSAGSIAGDGVLASLRKKWATCRAQRIINEAGEVFRFARGVILEGAFFALMDCETDPAVKLVYRAQRARALEGGETRFQLASAAERERVLAQSIGMASHGIVTEIDLDGHFYQAWVRERVKVALPVDPATEDFAAAAAANELDDERRKVKQLVTIVEKLRDQLARQSSNSRHSGTSPLKASAAPTHKRLEDEVARLGAEVERGAALRTEALQAQARAEEVTRRLQAKLRKEQRRCAALQSESDALLRAQESIRSRGDSLAEQLLSAERRIAEADTAARTGTVLHARDFELLQQRAEDEAQRADALQRELNSTKVLNRSSSGSSRY